MDDKTNNDKLIVLLMDLIDRYENEVVEFKEADNDYDKNKIGKYFSAISNEANLRSIPYGWLIFGVRDEDRSIVGTNYRDTRRLDSLKYEISQGTTGGISFLEIFEVYPLVGDVARRVIMFKIPAAVTAIPTAWHEIRYGRDGESLVPLSAEKYERIRRQNYADWSLNVISDSSLDDLDSEAVALARKRYIEKAQKKHIANDVAAMTDAEFLTKLRLMSDGRLTNAAMVLLGRADAPHQMERSPQAMWRLYGSRGNTSDYELFEMPFITLGQRLFAKIRNLKYRYMPDESTLFPQETQQYDQQVFYELINNCVAHQDYTMGARIYVNEFEDRISITNPGTFIPGSVEVVLRPSYAPPYYRNKFLADVMMSFAMIDSASMGIRNIYQILQRKYFPMPDYVLKDNTVSVTVYGKTLDARYTHLLFDNPGLALDTIYSIDKVQKKQPLTKEESRFLRKEKLIEGKSPNYYISMSVAKMIDDQADYIKNKGFNDNYYKDMIINYLRKFDKAKKQQINNLLLNKLPDILSDQQKNNKVKNILSAMKRDGLITRDGNNQSTASWILSKKS